MGASSSGKSTFLTEIVKQRKEAFFKVPTKVIVLYKHYQPLYDEMSQDGLDIVFLTQLPSETELTAMTLGHDHVLLLVDDQLSSIGTSSLLLDVFVRLCHHLKMSCFLLIQASNMSKSRYGSDIMRNAHYYILFKSAQIGHNLRSIGVRINDYKNLSRAYKLATHERPYTYLSVCLHPKASELERYSTDILPSDKRCRLFVSNMH